MLTEQTPAPDFSLLADDGSTVTLASLRGRPAVIYFYPKDNTPGCTKESCDFRDAFPRIATSKAAIIGVSPDSVASHVKFKRKYQLPFTLLADQEHQMAEAYGVWKKKSLFGVSYMGIERTTFLLDKNGVIVKIFSKVKPIGHAAKVEAALRALP
ncbi:MAG TPA: thioredoxin-dependent thiol peroxidase [Gemmatimonadaceae bacterium]|jgi:peroxiredoxin Q/BCP|nr:thioredoxin-dependent thiol peroxidase [Gemmatimonadaceae bacterium]